MTAEVTREEMIEALRIEIMILGERPTTARRHLAALSAAQRELEAGGWRPESAAPTNETVIVWGAGGQRFMRKDQHDQWRSMMGNPKNTPRFWHPMLPSPPGTSEGGGDA